VWNKWYINATGCLNTILGKHLVQPFFRDNLNSGAYIVLKEFDQDPDSFVLWEILSQAKSILSCLHSVCGICHVYQAPAQLTAQKQNYQLYQPFVLSKETEESQKHIRTADTRKLLGNTTVRRLACSVEFLSLPWVALLFPQYSVPFSSTCST
jgi:hypothetical protein